jgi:hypothetical protein
LASPPRLQPKRQPRLETADRIPCDQVKNRTDHGPKGADVLRCLFFGTKISRERSQSTKEIRRLTFLIVPYQLDPRRSHFLIAPYRPDPRRSHFLIAPYRPDPGRYRKEIRRSPFLIATYLQDPGRYRREIGRSHFLIAPYPPDPRRNLWEINP